MTDMKMRSYRDIGLGGISDPFWTHELRVLYPARYELYGAGWRCGLTVNGVLACDYQYIEAGGHDDWYA